jgi:hypothetical protein
MMLYQADFLRSLADEGGNIIALRKEMAVLVAIYTAYLGHSLS